MLTSQDYSITSCNELELVTHCTILDLLVTLGNAVKSGYLVRWTLHENRVTLASNSRVRTTATGKWYRFGVPVDCTWSARRKERPEYVLVVTRWREERLCALSHAVISDQLPLRGKDRIIGAIGITSRAVALQGSRLKYKSSEHEN